MGIEHPAVGGIPIYGKFPFSMPHEMDISEQEIHVSADDGSWSARGQEPVGLSPGSLAAPGFLNIYKSFIRYIYIYVYMYVYSFFWLSLSLYTYIYIYRYV